MTLKFLHISDLHLSHKDNEIGFLEILEYYNSNNQNDELGIFTTYDSSKLDSLAKIIIEIGSQIDFIIITGDISSTSREKDLIVSSQIITSTIEKIYDEDNNSLIPHPNIVMLPGNHDRLCIIKQSIPKLSMATNLNFETYFNTYWNPSHSQTKKIHYEAFKINEEKKVLFIKIDFSFTRDFVNICNIGKGNATQDILDELEQGLSKISQDNSLIPFIMLHYSPLYDTSKDLILINRKKFITLLEKYKIKYLFCGHTHSNEFKNYNSVKVICSSSTLSSGNNKSRINILSYDLNTDVVEVEESYYWRKNKYKFLKNF